MNGNALVIFYSWQSYIGGSANRGYIKKMICSAIKKKNVSIELLEDSRGSVGSPDIPDAILAKIAKSDIFICDITPVYTLNLENDKKRGLPNPNVMYELGFAVRTLGWERIICICNQGYGNVETLPFDISTHRIITYKKRNDSSEDEKPLFLDKIISEIVDNYDSIIAKRNEFDYRAHDTDIFYRLMSFASEEEFINGIKDFRSSGRYFRWYKKYWDYIQNFQDYPKNRFISMHLNESFMRLVNALEELNLLTCKICNAYNTKSWSYEEPEKDYTFEELKEIWMSQEYRRREIPYPDDNTSENIRKYYDAIEKDDMDIAKFSDDVITAFRDFRDDIKRELFI